MIKLKKIINPFFSSYKIESIFQRRRDNHKPIYQDQQSLFKSQQDQRAMNISINLINNKKIQIKNSFKYKNMQTLLYNFNIFSPKAVFLFSQSKNKKQRSRLVSQKQQLQQIKKKHGAQSDQYLSALQKIFQKHKTWNEVQEAAQYVQEMTSIYVKQYLNQKNMTQQLHNMYDDTFTDIIDWLQIVQKQQLAIKVLKKLIIIKTSQNGEESLQVLYEYDQMLNLYSQIQDYDYEQILQIQKKMMSIAAVHHKPGFGQSEESLRQFKKLLFGKFMQQYLLNDNKQNLIFATQKFDQLLSNKSFKDHQFSQQKILVQNKTLKAFTCFKSYLIEKSQKANQKALELLDLIDQKKYSQFIIQKRFQVCLNFLFIYSLKCEFEVAERFIKKCYELLVKINQARYQREYSLKAIQKVIKKKKELPKNIIQLQKQIITLFDKQKNLDYLKIEQTFNKIALQFQSQKNYPFFHYEQIKNTLYSIQHALNAIETFTTQKTLQFNIQAANQRINVYAERIVDQYMKIENFKEKVILLNGTQQVMQFPDFQETLQCLQIITGYILLFNYLSQQKNEGKNIFEQPLHKKLIQFEKLMKQSRLFAQTKEEFYQGSNVFKQNQ